MIACRKKNSCYRTIAPLEDSFTLLAKFKVKSFIPEEILTNGIFTIIYRYLNKYKNTIF